MVGTTLKKLMKDKCYCSKKGKDISLKECNLFDCGRWKKCMNKTKKKNGRRDKNGKAL